MNRITSKDTAEAQNNRKYKPHMPSNKRKKKTKNDILTYTNQTCSEKYDLQMGYLKNQQKSSRNINIKTTNRKPRSAIAILLGVLPIPNIKNNKLKEANSHKQIDENSNYSKTMIWVMSKITN